MRLFLILSFVFFAFVSSGQTQKESENSGTYEVLFGVVNHQSNNFSEIVSFLLENRHIQIISVCHAHNLIYGSINKKGFEDETAFVKFIETQFPGTYYFRKDCSEKGLNDFFRMCYEEIAKPR